MKHLTFPKLEHLPLDVLIAQGYRYMGTGDDIVMRTVRNTPLGTQQDYWMRDAERFPICKAFPNLKVYEHMWTYYENLDLEVIYDTVELA